MPRPHSSSIIRTLATTAAVALLFWVAILSIVAAYGMVKSHYSRTEYRALRGELGNDFIAVRLRSETEQRCGAVGREYFWICGVVIEAKQSLPFGYCSTPERPLYIGALDTASQSDLLGDLRFEHVIRVSDVLVSPTNSDTPYAYPHVFPPEEISVREPELSSDDARLGYSWVNFEGLPVLFASGSKDWKLTPEERENHPVGVIFKHPELPLRIATSIPQGEFKHWQDVVTSARSIVDEAVVSFNAGQSCSQPPKAVRFIYNTYNIGKLEALRDWVGNNHISTTPND